MDGEKKTVRNIGWYKIPGVKTGVKMELSESEEELMNLMSKVWEKPLTLMLLNIDFKQFLILKLLIN